MSLAASSQTAASARSLTVQQLLRYSVIGAVSNIALYVLYLALTGLALGPKTAMTLVYALGVAATFAFNSTWTFERSGVDAASFGRYVVTHAVGYGLNFAMLWMFVDRLGWPHRAVQAAAIVVVAGMLFAINKLWVFRAPASSSGRARR